MKKILLATTLLAGTAGFASAEGHITFSGSAAAGVASVAGAAFAPYVGAGLDVAFAGSTDGGLEFGASFGMTSGTSYGLGDAAITTGTGAFGAPAVYISGSFGKINFEGDEVAYTNTFGSVDFGLTADVVTGDITVEVDTDVSGLGLHMDTTTGGATNVSATYTTGGFTAEVGADNTSAWYVTGTYAAGSVTVEVTTDSASAWSASVDYAADGMSVGFSTDSASAWEVTAGYDLGGGLSLEAGMNSADDAFIGAAMAF